MKNKKVLFLFVAVMVLCLSTALFAACNKTDTPPSSGGFKEGDVIVDKDENTVTEKEYDEAGREVREISHVETLYNVTYLANDASVIYLKGNKSDEMYVSGYDGVPRTLSVKDLESKISLEGNAIVVKGITEAAFKGCETLTSVDLEKENTNALTFAIGDQAFANCPNLATVTLPTKVYMKSGSIGKSAFSNCESLTKVVIPDRFKTLGAYAFANCLKLETVTFNEGVAKVPQGFLYGCEALTSVTIPSTVNYVGSEAFSGCKKLTTITFPDSVTYVGSEALANCISLQSVKIPFIGNSYNPDSSTTLANLFGTHDLIDSDTEESYFYQIPAISGSRVRYIPSTLTSVEVTNATSLPAYAFAGLESLTSLSVTYSTADRIRVYDADTNYSNYDIPEITAVSAYAFAGLGHISDFPIPEKATAIGECAFTATGLTDAALVGILMKTQTIDDGAFSDLPNVTSVAIPQNVLSVDGYAFARNANLTSFLSTAKTALSSGILAECRSLETVTVPYIGTASVYYEDIDSDPVIISNGTPFATLFSTSVPSDLYDDEDDDLLITENYYSANRYYIPNTLNTITITSATAIPTNAFREILARNISITLNSDMLSDPDIDGIAIGAYAFYGCKNLTSYTLDSNYNGIGSYAFAFTGITSVTIPTSVKTVADNAFANCEKLTTFTVNGKNTAIFNSVLANCRSLESVTVPYIGTAFWATDAFDNEYLNYANNSFANLFSDDYPSDMYGEDDTLRDSPRYYVVSTSNYSNYYIPVSLDNIAITNAVAIPNYAFRGILASNITVNYDEDATNSERTSIGSCAFYGCANLTSFPIDSQIETIGSYAFAYTGITSVTVPQNVNSISNNAFANCQNLTTFTVNGKDVALSNSILANCRSLESVTVPYIGTASWIIDTYMGDKYLSYTNNAFANLFSSNYPEDMYSEDDTHEESPRYYQVITGNYSNYYIPVSLDTIVITNAVAIPNYAFRGILASSITVNHDEDATNSERTSIGSYAFYGCANLTSFSIDSQITSINNYAFANSGLTSITIPESVTYVSSSAFENCSNLESLTWNAAQASAVPDFSKSNIDTLVIGDDVKSIPSNAFNNMSYLTNVTATSLSRIGNGAFSGTPWLNNQIGAVYLGKVLFKYNGTLESSTGLEPSFSVMAGTNAIESYAFQNQLNLEDIYIPASVTRVGEYAFSGCNNLSVILYEGTQEQYDEIIKATSGILEKSVILSYVNDGTHVYQFNSDGATLPEYKQTTNYLRALPTLPEKTGYVFYGWYENEDFSGEPVYAPYYNKNGATLYARWFTQEEYDILFDGTSFEKAKIAHLNQTYNVNITTGGQYVYFKFVPSTSGTYSIKSTGTYDTEGYLYNSNQDQIRYDDSGANDSYNNFKITYVLTAGEVYYIRVKMYNSSKTGTFKITITMN